MQIISAILHGEVIPFAVWQVTRSSGKAQISVFCHSGKANNLVLSKIFRSFTWFRMNVIEVLQEHKVIFPGLFSAEELSADLGTSRTYRAISSSQLFYFGGITLSRKKKFLNQHELDHWQAGISRCGQGEFSAAC
jgi:hypothetical protein